MLSDSQYSLAGQRGRESMRNQESAESKGADLREIFTMITAKKRGAFQSTTNSAGVFRTLVIMVCALCLHIVSVTQVFLTTALLEEITGEMKSPRFAKFLRLHFVKSRQTAKREAYWWGWMEGDTTQAHGLSET